MKLELNLNIKLLVVQFPTEKLFIENHAFFSVIKIASFEEHVVKFICKGSDLTEDIAKGFLHQSIHTGLFAHYVKDIPVNTYCYKTALEAFDAVIYAYGCHWGENPEGDQPHNTGLLNLYPTGHALMDVSLDEAKKWIEAESRTFYPEKCIICEII